MVHSNAAQAADLPSARTVGCVNFEPLDPFAGDPDDPASQLPRVTDEEDFEPLIEVNRMIMQGLRGDGRAAAAA